MKKLSLEVLSLILYSSSALAWNTSVPAGTTVTGGDVRYGENQSVYGTTINQTVSGTQDIKSGGLSENSTIYDYALQDVEAGGKAIGTHILMRGQQDVNGEAEDSIVDKYASMYVRSGGKATGTEVNGGTFNVYAGGAIENTNLNSGTQALYGTSQNMTIGNGGTQNVNASGTATNTTINSGGRQNVAKGGTATETIINGGRQYVYGTANKTTLESGRLTAYSGSILNDTIVNDGSMEINQANISGLTINGGNFKAYSGAEISSLSMYGGNGTLYTGAQLSGDITINNASLKLYSSQNLNNVNMDNGTISMTYNDSSEKLSIQSLNGSGNFYLTSAVTEGELDQLDISSGSGKFGIQLYDYSNGGSLPDTIKLVTTPDNDEQFYLIGGATDIGAYQYTLQHQGDEWFLQRSFNPTESALIAKNTYSTISTIFYTHLDTLNRRLGDVRFNKKDGLWIRGFGRNVKISHQDDTKTKIDTYGTQFGYDYMLPQTLVSKWLVGVFAGTSTTKDKFDLEGHADIDTYSTGLYTTLFGNNGYYLDLVGSYYHSRQDLTTYTPDGMPVRGKYDLDAWSFSAEGGKRFELSNGYFVEPQIQVSYMDLGDISYRTNFNTLVRGRDFDVLSGRAGLRGGKRFSEKFEAFVQADLIHDFDHKSTIDIANLTLQEDISSTRWRLGGGFTADFSDSTGSYFNISTTLDDKVEIPIDVNLGLRYEF